MAFSSSLSPCRQVAPSHEFAHRQFSLDHLSIDSTLANLRRFDCSVSASLRGAELRDLFEAQPLLPGAIVIRDCGTHRETLGLLSRKAFFRQMSQRYSVDLFSRRSIAEMLDYVQTPMLVLPIETAIVAAAQASLARPPELLYEPVVIDCSDAGHVGENRYSLVDVHQLLVAQARIHELTKQLLERQTKEHAIQTEKMAILGRSIAGIAHEVRNPVNCIHGNMKFLETYFNDLDAMVRAYETGSDADEIEELAEEIELDFLREDLPSILKTLTVSSKRMRDIVESLRSFSRVGSGKRQPFDVHTCLDSSLLILNSRFKSGVTFDKRYGSIALDAVGYSGQIGQVFLNLIANALDALTYSSTPIEEPTISIVTEQIEERAIVVKIRDNGPGIPESIRARIFEDFFTTKPEDVGTGMGLAIVHQIITENHGGRITFRTDAAWGTEFEISLPAKPKVGG